MDGPVIRQRIPNDITSVHETRHHRLGGDFLRGFADVCILVV